MGRDAWRFQLEARHVRGAAATAILWTGRPVCRRLHPPSSNGLLGEHGKDEALGSPTQSLHPAHNASLLLGGALQAYTGYTEELQPSIVAAGLQSHYHAAVEFARAVREAVRAVLRGSRLPALLQEAQGQHCECGRC